MDASSAQSERTAAAAVAPVNHHREAVMKKLHLDPLALAVTSFPTTAALDARVGTVEAHEATNLGQLTCGASCNATCNTSCGGGGHCTCYPA
jgi:hypothetical protein